jgi:hypothetical protein
MPRLVQIGSGRVTHLRADGSGPVPEGRARCELTKDGDFDPYLRKDRSTESPLREAESGTPTCQWCRTRELPA